MSRLDTHVAVVQRRLALVTFVEWLAASGFVLGALALLTVLFERATQIGLPPRSLWIGAGLAVLVAGVMTVINRPSRQGAAVAIDEKLSLKEKFSTALCVRQSRDPFAQAVVLDAEKTAEKVHLQGQFPVRFPRMGYATVAVALLALLATLVPQMDLLGKEKRAEARRVEELKIAQAKDIIRETIAKVESMPLSVRNNEEVRIAKEHLADLVKHPMPDPQVAARRRMELLGKADEAMKKQMEASKAFAQSQRNATMFRSMSPPVDAKGPVADAQREIAKGSFREAAEDLKKAVESFKDMSVKDKQAAVEQLQKMADQLAAMSQDQRQEQKLAGALKQMGVKEDEIKKAQELIEKAAMGDKKAQQQIQQAMQQMAQQMNNGQGANPQQQQQMQKAVQQAMQGANAQCQAGQMAQAAQAMAKAMQQMQAGGNQAGQQMAGAQQQMKDLLGQLEAMQQDAEAMAAAQKALQDAMAQAGGECNGNGEGEGDKLGPGGKGEWAEGDPDQFGRGQGGPGIGWGGRGDKNVAPSGFKQERSPTHYDPKGEHLASMMVKDRSVRGESKAELAKVAQAAQAEEGEDIDDSVVDRRSQQVKLEYFRVIGEEAKK